MNLANKYRKLDQREHILQRPNMYIGSVEHDTFKTWAWYDGGVQFQELAYVPGLYKIFDEILVNAIDHATRLKRDAAALNQVKTIKVNIHRDTGYIEVYNDGDGIDVDIHPEHGIYIPELIFGNLLTSANYDDTEEKVIGGQNGIGAKACNVFSKHFVVETIDAKRKKLYVQNFHNNMSEKDKPLVTSCKKKPYTRIRFLPDYARFNGCVELTDAMYALLCKRVHDACAVTDADVAVWLNDHKLEHKTFEKYVDLYIGAKSQHTRAYEKLDDRWEIVAAMNDSGEFQHVSFVNGIWTLRGGKHVEYITNQIVKKLVDLIQKRKKETVKAQHIRDNLIVFVKSVISNPAFDSQTKETLTTPSTKFGNPKPEVSDKFIDKLYKSGIVEKVIMMSNALDNKKMQKTDGKKKSVIRNLVKLEDANWAGTSKSHECTLILTEGDSAMTMAMSGIDEVGRDRYGVFPLKGKLLNVKDVGTKKIIDNEEIANLKKIIGLEADKEYTNVKDLRYGRVMALCDSDVDGSHIKGLLFNVFHTLWPSLFRLDGFLMTMLTPIIKARKGNRSVSFYTITDYENWRNDTESSGWEVKYYKGLGTSNAQEAREYFKQLKLLVYRYEDDEDDHSIDLAFNKKRTDDRKQWLAGYDKQRVLDFQEPVVRYKDFVHKDLIHFSNYDVKRSIPSLVDGLKVSQRKIVFACFQKKWQKECRVAQLSAYVSEHSAYHHGEESLNKAIISLAQDFVGSNNINLLQPNGQFGSRRSGGKDHSSPRYIYTELSPVTRFVFKKEDESVLTYLDDDGYKVEPEFYIPTIPFVLVNGANGIGTGFSTSIPCYNPIDIIACIKQMLRGDQPDFDALSPWYRNFKGTISKEKGKFVSKGVYERLSPTKVRVTELPVGMWTEEFKELLESALDNSKLKSYESHYTDVRVDFVLHFATSKDLDALLALDDNGHTGFENAFKLVSTRGLGVTNMYLFNCDGQITKYETLQQVFEEFYKVRLSYYDKRKAHQLADLEEKKVYMQARVVFIDEIVSGSLIIHNQPKDVLEEQLESRCYPKKDDSFDYLVTMPIYSFTLEKKRKLQDDLSVVMETIKNLSALTCEQIWEQELDDLRMKYEAVEAAKAKHQKHT